MNTNRRDFLKTSAIGSAGIISGLGLSAKGFAASKGANDKIRIGIIGFSGRARHSLIPSFYHHADELNFEIVAVSDIWNKRRDEAKQFFKEEYGIDVGIARNNEELYEKYKPDAVIISTADFQHAMHTIEGLEANCDIYVEKPFAETMDDANAALDKALASGKIIQIGSQRRSGLNYHAANDYLSSGAFGGITFVEMSWNVNQPGRWRRPELVAGLKESDVDWKRYIMNRPFEPFDARKYLEYRLFWPYSTGIPGQWMCHLIDTVHWFTGLNYPKSVAANGGIYAWDDGRTNFDTMTAVFDYEANKISKNGFQVVFSSRQHNSAGRTKEHFFSNGGMLDLSTNKVTPTGGMEEYHAKAMGMEENKLDEYDLISEEEKEKAKVVTDANTGSDPITSAHMRNWMKCILSREQTNADVWAGYNHSVAGIMTFAALSTGSKSVFDKSNRQVIANGKPFKY